jgi:hypothetical protein
MLGINAPGRAAAPMVPMVPMVPEMFQFVPAGRRVRRRFPMKGPLR